MAIAFEEPDLVIGSGEDRIGLACKRPRSVRGLMERIKEGADQISRSRIPGMIVIGLEAILHTSDEPEKPTVTYVVGTPDQLLLLVQPIIDEAIVAAHRQIKAAFEKGVAGILFCGLATGIATRAG
ncbi:MAG: hypothetical protein ACREA0_32310, partial [bacterium]